MAAYSLETFAPERSAGYLIKRVHAEVMAAVEPLFADTELTFTQWAALVSVHFGNGGTCAALARDLNHDMGATSRLIATLEERGLLRRERSAEDRRVQHLLLTEDGAALAAAHRARLVDSWNRWLDGWSEEELDGFLRGLRRLHATLEAEREAQS